MNRPGSTASSRIPRAPLLACVGIAISWVAVLVAGGAGTPVLSRPGSDPQPVRFNRDVRPLLADRCFHCHGPDEKDRKGRLRLDRADGPEGAYRSRGGMQAISPRSLERSAVWYRLTTEDPDDAMPPAGSHKKRLDADELDIIRRWILAGAEYEDHWAFVKPTRPSDPKVDGAWSRRPIDRFVLRRMEMAGLSPSPRADKRTLIRRLTLDLTGLPPTRAEISAFVRDESPDAYERLVDRLLSDPQYGEHMAKYWLDLVRFADTNGVHHDHFRDMTPYRDWVIRSFNANLPFDQFITDQVAGDLHAEPSDDQLIASGFNRLHMIIDRGTALPEESFTRNVVDRVTAFGTAFLGLTVQCAVCHDHKYDPIRQADFYALFAFFNNLDAEPETGGRSGPDFRRGLQRPYISFPTEEQTAALAEVDQALAAERTRVDTLKQALADAKGEKGALNEDLKKAQKELGALRKKKNGVLVGVRAAMVMKERAEVRAAHVLIRGDYRTPGPRVDRATPSFLPSMTSESATTSRMDLARWLVSREHPLTARVTVNRLWHQLFGVGIVKTVEDFGTQGEWPTHPDLLDYLAVSLVESGWNVKAMIKQVVTSATYQQSSAASPEAFAKDPENRLLARGSRFRMDSEMIRDQVLATSGLLNTQMYGRSVKPPQPPGIWKAVSLPSSYPRTYTPDGGDDIHRRSIYTFWKRGMPPPQMSILNAPTREFCTARRERTNTPLQALLLMNETEYLKAARHLAGQTLAASRSAPDRLRVIYETITSKVPDAAESDALLKLVQQMQATYARTPALARQLCDGVRVADDRAASELAAWTMLASTVYNLDITKTRE